MQLTSLDWVIVAVSLFLCYLPATVLHPAIAVQCGGVLHIRTVCAVVARRNVDGRDDLQHRHAESGH